MERPDGLAGTGGDHTASWPAAAGGGPRRDARGHEELAGRAGLLRAAEDWLRDFGSGVLVVSGPAGIGKTRLLDEVVRRARAHRILTATGTACARPIPFGALAHLLRDVDTPNRLDLLAALARQLRARSAMLAVDDAHLLDDWSAALVHHLVIGRLLRVVLAVRLPGPAAPDAILSVMRAGHARWLRLTPLSFDETAACLRQALGAQAVVDDRTVGLVMAASGGNPLLVRETTQEALRTGDLVHANGVWRLRRAVLPSTLEEQLDRRLARLDPTALEAVQLIALGEPLELQPLEALAGAAALEEAEREGLIDVAESGRRRSVRLAHPLMGEAVRSRLPALAQRRAYRRLTSMLAGLPRRRRDDPLRLATWHLTSGEPLPADALLAGARLAARRHDHSLAARLATAAEQAGAGFAARLLAAESDAWCGRLEAAAEALASLETLAREPTERGAVARVRATVLSVGLGRLDDAREVISRALAGPLSTSDREVLEGVRIVVDLATGDPRRALASAQLVTSPDTDPVIRLHLLPALVTALSWTGRTHTAAEVGEGVLDDGPPYLVETARATVAFAHAYGGRLSRAVEVAREGYDRAREWQADDLRGVWGYALGYAQLAGGRVDAAATLLAETSALLRERLTLFGVRGLANCLGALAEAHACAGRPEAAEEALRTCDALPTAGHYLPHVVLGRSWTLAAHGSLEAARAMALDLAHESVSRGCPTYAALAAHTVVRLGGVTDLAASLACEAPIVGVYADHARGVSTVDGVLLDGVAARFETAGALLLAAEAYAHAYSAHAAKGARRAAQAAAARSRALARQCAPANTPPLRLIHERTELTTREREVAALVASGLSNREAARRLGVSPRTVENHLHRLYAKLGVAGRDELAALFGTSGPDQP